MAAVTPESRNKSAPVSPGEVELVLAQIESLPTLGVIANRLLEMSLDDRFGTGDLAALIESDQSLSARILSLIRKSNVGTDVRNVQRAVVLLGRDVVRSLVLGVQIFELFRHRVETGTSGFDRVGFWRHSLAVGCAARLIAEKRLPNLAASGAAQAGWPLARPEEAFVCGLLHDLGKVVFDACFPKSYERVVERSEAANVAISDVEREVFGVDHAVAGHRLAAHWKLPPAIAESMWLHHQAPESTPTRIAFPDHVLVVQAADRLVRQMRIGYSGSEGKEGITVRLDPRVGLTDEIIREVMVELPESIELRAELLGLEELTSREVLAETLVRTNAELARLNAELAVANRRLQQRSRTLDALCTFSDGGGDDATHEAVVRAMLLGLQEANPAGAFAVLFASPARQVSVLGMATAGDDEPQLRVLANAAVGNLDVLRRLTGHAPAEATVPAPLLDHLRGLLEVGSARCWAMPCPGQLIGAVLAAGVEADEIDGAIQVLGRTAASWLHTAESAYTARQLTEELAEINRRYANSQAEAARMRSLAMVGEMAAGAAHEINNPLAVISGRAQLLTRDDVPEAIRKNGRIISEHAHRASAIVNELMDFAKPEPPAPSDWPVGPFLGDIRHFWLDKNVLPPEQFALEVSDDLPQIHADPAQIRVLFDEVIRNAVEAMRDQPRPRLVVNCRSDVADDSVVIRVEDNGCGMTTDVCEHAFDPFFSHRSAGRGRGLGLSRAARYAEINGGTIRLSSRVKEGTSVIVELPVSR